MLLISTLTSSTISNARLSYAKKTIIQVSWIKIGKGLPNVRETLEIKKRGSEVIREKTVMDIVNDSMVKDVYVWDLSVINEKIIVKHFRGSTRDDRKTQLTTTQHWSWSCIYSYR